LPREEFPGSGAAPASLIRQAERSPTCAAPLPAPAQPPEKPQPDAAFGSLDRNGDGYLSRAEAGSDREVAKRFDRFDANRDGRLAEEEWRRAAEDNQKRVLADSTITTKV
jgi:hypothetical protein